MTSLFQGFLRAGLVLSSLNLAAGSLGYAFQVFIGRVLEPTEFAIFNAILAVVSLACAPLNAMIRAISRHVSALRGGGDMNRIRLLYESTGLWLMVVGGLAAAALQGTGATIQDFLRVADPRITWIVVAILVGGSAVQINNAFLQGLRCFGWLGGLGVAGVALKIGLCAMLILVCHGGLQGALVGVLASSLLVGVVGTGVILKAARGVPQRPAPQWKVRVDGIVPIMVAGIAFTGLTQFDVALANHFFDPVLAGEFTAAAILGKAVLYVPGGIVLALFPIAVENHVAGRADGRLAWHALVATLCLCGAAALTYAVLGPWVVAFLFGGKYQVAGGLLAVYGLAIMPMGVAMVAEHLLIAKGRMTMSWVFLVAVLAEVALLRAWHPSPLAMIGVMAIFNTLLAAISCLLLLSEVGRKRPLSAETEQ